MSTLSATLTTERSSTKPVRINDDVIIGGNAIIMMAGPCSIESYEQTRITAAAVAQQGATFLRGGAFKPRTSPYAFQGLALEGLKIMRAVADEFGLLVITEALGVENVAAVSEYADIIQIGSRNMQHYPLLWAAGDSGKPILLKRGFMSTMKEWLAAAEHIISRGNEQIILCERGIRGFDSFTRNVLDTNAIAYIKANTPFPIIGDPSHATGRSDLVIPAARAAIAAGADGLIVETHPDPANALSDGDQSLPLDALPQLFRETGRIAAAMNRAITQ